MVECGVCENRFHIRDEVVIRVRKFYPGEKRHHGLNRFQRVSYSQPINAPMTADEIAPSSPHLPTPPPVVPYQPAPPQRILAGMLGIGVMIGIGLLMLFGSDHGGPLDGMEVGRKLLLAGFTSLLGLGLLIYANPNTRGLAAGLGLLASCGLMAIPLFIREGSSSIDEANAPMVPPAVNAKDNEPANPQQQRITTIRERAGLRPLEQEIERLRQENDSRFAYGLLLVGLQESNRIAVRDYMFRVTSAAPSSHIYPRNEREYLFVLTGLDLNLERLAAMASPLGTVTDLIPELNLAVVAVNNDVFVEPPSGTLVDRAHPEFYELNLRELKSIDLQRVERAVARLADSEPRMYRVDIARRLRELMSESGVNFHASIAKALRTWDTDIHTAALAAGMTARILHERGDVLPTEVAALALEKPTPELVPVLVDQWRNNTLMWEGHCVRLGSLIESAMLRELENANPSLIHSAVRVLGHVGGNAARAKLESLRESAEPELRVVVNRALERISSRNSAE